MGAGFGGPAIYGNEVYLLDRENSAKDIVRCLELKSGKELWRYEYDAPGETSFNGTRSTPTVTDKYVFTVGLMWDFYCFDRKTHKPLWNVNLLQDYLGGQNTMWGISQSPALYKDMVMVSPQSGGPAVVAYKQATGEVVWKSESMGGMGYVSPLVTTLGGKEQVLMVAKDLVAGISLEDGSILWSYDGWSCKIPIPNATPLPGDRVFITGEYGAGSAMIQIKKGSGGFSAKELYKSNDCGSQIHQPILYKDHLYMNSNGNRRRDGMLCLALDGTRVWRTEDDKSLPNFERGGLLLAGDLIVCLDGKSGYLHLVNPSTDGYRELGRAKLFEGEQMWAPLAYSNGSLLVRSQNELKCLDLRNP
jgi:outer membrane protein assembly factor BamB